MMMTELVIEILASIIWEVEGYSSRACLNPLLRTYLSPRPKGRPDSGVGLSMWYCFFERL